MSYDDDFSMNKSQFNHGPYTLSLTYELSMGCHIEGPHIALVQPSLALGALISYYFPTLILKVYDSQLDLNAT